MSKESKKKKSSVPQGRRNPKMSEEERMQLIDELAKRYVNGEEIEKLSTESGITVRTLYRYFKSLDVSRRDSNVGATEIRKRELEADRVEAGKIIDIAIGIGGPIARRNLPLIDHLMNEGRSLQLIAQDIVAWFEAKAPTEQRIAKLENELTTLREELGRAYGMALPNFRFYLKTQLLERYANSILVARLRGIRIPVKPALVAYQRELDKLDRDIGESLELPSEEDLVLPEANT